MAAFLCFAEHSQFCILRPVRADGQFGLKHLATVFAPEYDLIDYSVTPYGRIVALWTNPDGVPMLRYADFASGRGDRAGWTDVILESPLDPYFAPTGGEAQFDPRQVYLKQLFYPGRFSIQTLSKTVNVSSIKSGDVICNFMISGPPYGLRDRSKNIQFCYIDGDFLYVDFLR